MIRLWFIVLIVFYLTCQANLEANTRIAGFFPEASGEEIRLMTWDDLISYKAVELTSAYVDEDGYFQLTADLEETRLMFFRYKHGRSFIYLDPGQSYELDFDIVNPNDSDKVRSLHPMHQGLGFDILKPAGKKDVNTLVAKMDSMVGDYLENKVMPRPRANHRPSLNEFRQLTDSVFAEIDHPFVNSYNVYYLAYLEATLNTRSLHDLIGDYISNQEILYHNPMFMDFFSSLFGNYVFTGTQHISRRNLHEAVNIEGSHQALSEILGQDEVLKPARLRELVMIKSLQSMLNISEYDNKQVLDILRYMSNEGKFGEHRKMASNILYREKKLKPGHPAPGMVLKDEDDNVVFDLQDKKGDHVYLFFLAGWCPVSMSEIGPMADIADRFQDELAVVGVLVDNKESLLIFAGQDDETLPFKIYHYGGDYRLLDDYSISTIPQYVLIDPEGNILDHPFPAPSAGVSDRLERIIR